MKPWIVYTLLGLILLVASLSLANLLAEDYHRAWCDAMEMRGIQDASCARCGP